jgi:hypothetical protein
LKHLRVIHRLRLALALAAFLLVVAAAGVVWWANHTGLPEAWRGLIEDALAVKGIHAEVGGLRYLPLRGIEANEVVLYRDASRRRTIGRFNELVLDVNPSQLYRGNLRLDRLDLTGARVSLMVDPDDPETETLEISNLRGRLDFLAPRGLMASGVSGLVGGVELHVGGRLELYEPSETLSREAWDRSESRRRKLLLNVIESLEHLELDGPVPPRLHVNLEGDLDRPESLRARMSFSGDRLTCRDLEIERVDIRADLLGDLLVVDHAEIVTPDGALNGRAEYETGAGRGTFELGSTLRLPEALRRLRLVPDGLELPRFTEPPTFGVQGNFSRREESDGAADERANPLSFGVLSGWRYQLIGDFDWVGPSYRHWAADRFRAAFSWDGSRLMLDNAEIREGPRKLEGRAFFTADEIRYRARGDLSLGFYQNAIDIEPLSTVLDDFTPGEAPETRVRFEGRANPRDRRDCSFRGEAEARHIRYRGVPARRARVDLDLTHNELIFRRGEVEFDYRDYPLRVRHDGPDRGEIEVDRIRYHHPKRTVTVDSLRGTAWPAPVVRTFAPEVADELEAFGFHRPPKLEADGRIHVVPRGAHQDLTVRFRTAAPMDYEFLGRGLEIAAPKGRVRILPDRLELRGLSGGAFGGLIRAEIDQSLGDFNLRGELDWTGLGLPAIAEAYEFSPRPPGQLTGRIKFELTEPGAAGLGGRGHIALEDGALFDVPVFGPLSPVISGVLGRPKAGFQEATDAFCHFEIENGVMRTADFLTTTPSMVFTGDGVADLNRRLLRMTIRMNARGLLGVLTLPLKPLYGLFQFRGSGPIADPEWRNVRFTSPPPDQEQRLLSPPKAVKVGDPPDDVADPRPSSPRDRPSPPNR